LQDLRKDRTNLFVVLDDEHRGLLVFAHFTPRPVTPPSNTRNPA
jgi:hypothetical protein